MPQQRLVSSSRIDRSRPLRFRFDGREYTGYAGDTLASALLANGVMIMGRSLKYHRPRGPIAAGEDEPNAIVQVEPGTPWSEPNVRATTLPLYDGLVARSVNTWPSARFDMAAGLDILGRFLPAGFYYKTFKWPRWETFEPLIRRMAGLGVPPAGPDPDAYLHRFAHCDVLVVGAGPSGLAAAESAAAAGKTVILAEAERELGVSARIWDDMSIDDTPAMHWVEERERALAANSNVTLLRRTTITGYYDHNLLVGLEQLEQVEQPRAREGPRQRLWKIRARDVVLATGAHERPLVFPDNDRPGIMLAEAALTYAALYGVSVGQNVVVCTNNDRGYRTASALMRRGVAVRAILDVRPAMTASLPPIHDAIPVRRNVEIIGTRRERGRVSAVGISERGRGDRLWLRTDALLMSGGHSPAVQLFSQSGGKLIFDAELQAFVPDMSMQAECSIGAARGTFYLTQAIAEGRAAGAGAPLGKRTPNSASACGPWRSTAKGRQWVDFQSDVTAKDLGLAAREGFVSVEHMKRYTTTGMATDQGKTSNVNALAILGEETSRAPAFVGTTRFRPPYVPITMSAVAGGMQGDLYAPRRLMPMDDWHRKNGAVMEDFSGWQRPDVYLGHGEGREDAVVREVRAVRENIGLFDSSPIGKIEVSGRDAAQFLDFMVANRVANLKPGRARYSLMLNENGVIIDDGVIVRFEDSRFLVSSSSGATPRIAAWLEEWRQCEYPHRDLRIADLTTAQAAIAIAGPRSRELLSRLGATDAWNANAFPHMAVREIKLGGVPARIMRISFTGELQYELQVPASFGPALWEALVTAGHQLGLMPVGIEAWLRLRLDKGYIHVGADTDGTTLPDDIGFGRAIAAKPSDFVGRRSLLREEALRADREQLVGLETLDGSQLDVGACLFKGDTFTPPVLKEGRVTSSAYSVALQRPVALGLVRAGRARMGEVVSVYALGRIGKARIVASTFYDPEGARLHA